MMDFNALRKISHLIRLPNLLIIVGTFAVINYKAGGIYAGQNDFFLLLIGTVLIAAAGNIINDIYDLEIDAINKPEKLIIGQFISLKRAWQLYGLLNGIAFAGAVYSRNLTIGIFFLIGILLLYFYSYQWKRKMLIGNLVVAFLCALVVVEYWWIARENLTNYWHGILLSYVGFAFLSTLARELIKDIEDIEGDRIAGCETLVIQLGEQLTKRIILVIFGSLLLILLFEAFFFYQNEQLLPLLYTTIVLVCVLFYLIYKSFKAANKAAYHSLSKLLKGYMLLGLGLLLLA